MLRAHGWRPVALEYSPDGAEVCAERDLAVIRADARFLPFPSAGLDLVVAFDILEHIEEDHLAAAEIRRVLRPGGTALIAVPADMRLWSAHDEAVGHVRRYDRAGLLAVDGEGRPRRRRAVELERAAAARPRPGGGAAPPAATSTTSPGPVNLGLRAVIAAERYLPVKSLPGVSLMLRAHRPSRRGRHVITRLKALLGSVPLYVALQKALGADRLRYRCLDELGLRDGDTVIDVGCGPAYYFDRLPKVTYFGFDTSERYIAHAPAPLRAATGRGSPARSSASSTSPTSRPPTRCCCSASCTTSPTTRAGTC